MAFPVSIALLLMLEPAPSPPAHRAHGNIARLISNDDYPVEALRNNEQGQVAVRLDIDPGGRVSACTISSPSGSAVLDRTTCSLLQERAHFTPARDRKGRPVADTITQTITWRLSSPTLDPAVEAASRAYFICAAKAAGTLLGASTANETVVARAMAACPDEERNVLAASLKAPGTAPSTADAIRKGFRPALLDAVQRMREAGLRARPDPATGGLVQLVSNDDYPPEALRNEEQGTVAVRLDVDTSGRASACTVMESSGSPSLDAGTCSLLQQRARFIPARDKNGRLVADTFVQRITWRINDEGGAGDTGAPPALQQWVRCLGGEARRLAPAGAAPETVADRAFSACTADEQSAAAAIGEPSPTGGGKVLPKALRESARRTILDLVQGIRASGGGG